MVLLIFKRDPGGRAVFLTRIKVRHLSLESDIAAAILAYPPGPDYLVMTETRHPLAIGRTDPSARLLDWVIDPSGESFVTV